MTSRRHAVALLTLVLAVTATVSGCRTDLAEVQPKRPVVVMPESEPGISAVLMRQEALVENVRKQIRDSVKGPKWRLDKTLEKGIVSGCKGVPAAAVDGATYGVALHPENIDGFVVAVTSTWYRGQTNAKAAADAIENLMDSAGYQRLETGLFANKSGDTLTVRPEGDGTRVYSETGCYRDDSGGWTVDETTGS